MFTQNILADYNPNDALSQSELLRFLPHENREAARLAAYRDRKSGKLKTVPGEEPSDVRYEVGHFFEWAVRKGYFEAIVPTDKKQTDATCEETAGIQHPCHAVAHSVMDEQANDPTNSLDDVEFICDGGECGIPTTTSLGECTLPSINNGGLPASQQPPSLDILGHEPATLVDVEVVDDQAELATRALTGTNHFCHLDDGALGEANFWKHDRCVKASLAVFEISGNSLKCIRDNKLWKHGGFQSWEDYCASGLDITKRHADRLISSSEIMAYIRMGPIGPIVPSVESQVRPLSRLTEPTEQVEAWRTAVARAGDRQPTAKLISQVVSEILGPVQPRESAQSETEPQSDIVELYNRILESLHAERPHKEIVSDLIKLGGLMDLANHVTQKS